MSSEEMANITNWIVLHKLKAKFVTSIKFVCIFGETGNEVLIVTKDDNVFAFGNNKNGCLGLGHDCSQQEPTKVADLCSKQIVNIAYGYSHVIAITKNGDIYSWGYNDFGQLGNGTTINSNRPKVINDMIGKRVTDIMCGTYHSLALTHTGEVFSWGHNNCGQIGNGNTNNQLTPVRLHFDNIDEYSDEKIVAVSCGYYFSMAITSNGLVYGWGYNANGELGVGNLNNQYTPALIVIRSDSVVIKKIQCGSNHSLFLSTDGDIYACGYNNYGSLGNGNNSNQNTPIKINHTNKFIDIASQFWSNVSVALSQYGYCFVWGECISEMITVPRETPFKSFHDIFAIYSKRKITFKPIYFDEKSSVNRISHTISSLLNDQKFSDFKFKVESKYIHVHKLILKARCEHFQVMFSEKWTDSDAQETEITQYSYSVFYSFLKYIYTDIVDIRLEEAMDLLDLANSYFEEDLKQKCAEIIKNDITIENVCIIYSAAVKYNLKELENNCFQFSLNKFNEICKTDAFFQMDDISCKSLMIRAAESGAFKV